MADVSTLKSVKAYIRRKHNKLDEELEEEIDACLSDLRIVGIDADEHDETILHAIKIYVKANTLDDTAKAAEYLKRYDAMKATLMMAEGYGGNGDA